MRYLHNDTVRVTILRYPPQHFESMYQYFNLKRLYGTPLNQLLATLPNKASFSRKKLLKNGYNQMSFDLGLQDYRMEDEQEVREFVGYIDAQFDYVMITEYMEASLVMLADLMGWPLEYVSSLPLMERDPLLKYKLTPTDEMKITWLNKADTILYNHFLEKFRRRAFHYGLFRLTEDVKTLRRINQDLANKCIHSTHWNGSRSRIISYRLKELSDWDCVHATKSELRFTDELRREQAARLKTIKNVYKLINVTRKDRS